MQKAVAMEKSFPCNKKIIFQMLENEFKSVNGIQQDLYKGLEINHENGLLEILDYEENKILSIQIITPKDTYIQTYEFHSEDDKTQMKYEEEYNSNSLLRILNFKLVRLLHRKKYYKRIDNMFLSIEQKIKEAN